MSKERLYREDFNRGFAKGYNRYEKASWKNIRKVLPTAADTMIRLDKDIELLYDSFEQYGYATSILCVSLMNYPGDVLSQDVLYELVRAVCTKLDIKAKAELQAVLDTQIRIFLKRNDSIDSVVLNRMTKLKHDCFS